MLLGHCVCVLFNLFLLETAHEGLWLSSGPLGHVYLAGLSAYSHGEHCELSLRSLLHVAAPAHPVLRSVQR